MDKVGFGFSLLFPFSPLLIPSEPFENLSSPSTPQRPARELQPSTTFTTHLRLVATQVARIAEQASKDALRQREYLWDLVTEYGALSAGTKDLLVARAQLLKEYQRGNQATQTAHEKLVKLVGVYIFLFVYEFVLFLVRRKK